MSAVPVRRVALLSVSLAFITAMVGLLITDVSEYGIHPLDVLAVPILVFLGVALVGSLRRGAPPPP